MKEVAAKAMHLWFRPLAVKGIPIERLVAGTDVSIDMLRSRKARFSWAELCVMLGNVTPSFTEEELVEIGRSYIRSQPMRFAFVIGRVLLTPMGFYRYMNKPRAGAGNQMFSCIVPSHRELSETECVVDLTLPDEYEVCWPFFLLTKGNFEEIPRLLGHPPATVSLLRIPGGGRYHITIRQRPQLIARLLRALSWPFTVRAAARELREAHETLVERYAELEDARARLDRQATQLRTTHSVNQLVQRDLDLGRTLDTMARALVEEAGFAWAEITLLPQPDKAADPAPAARRAEYGAVPLADPYASPEPRDRTEPGKPTRARVDDGGLLQRSLEAGGGEVIGQVKVVPAPGGSRVEREELLAFIAPTLALALQNALSYQALADYRSGLERLVDQRTAELRQARDELAGTVAELREAQGARERFFGNISHEIRTPLSLILLATADVRARAGEMLDDRARGNLASVTDAANKLVRLVDELLLLAAGQEDKLRARPERTDLSGLIGAVVTAWRPAVDAAGLTMDHRVVAGVHALVDPVAIERVASNLVSNAVKYTPSGGRIEIELAVDADGLRLSVFDTGPGFGEDLQGRLFGRFERASGEPYRKLGTGLGLYLAKQLVEAHAGTIAAHPRAPGPGSELRVVLPTAAILADEPAPARPTALQLIAEDADPTPPVTRFTPPGYSAGTILVAEDDARLAEMIGRVLGDEYTIAIAHDGEAALAMIPKVAPQLLITDVDMPGLSGIELSRRFRDLTGDRLAPIIVVSAMLDRATRIAGLEAGAVDYVTKPFDPLELRARIRAQFRMRDLAIRLQRAEQLSAMGILTAGLAHELRNPANGIVNAIAPLTELLPRDVVRPDTAVGQLLEVLNSCADQIGFLSRQLLGFRKGVVDLDLRQIPVRELVHRAMTMAHAGSVEIRLDATCDGVLKCAPPLLLQVLTNLIENAVYAAGPGGWVQVRTSATDTTFTVEVSDSGAGVPGPLRERVFEPFFTTKPAGIGTGLGLSLARDIAHRHNGVLEIRDRDNRSCFVLELPHYSTLDAATKVAMMPSPRTR